MGDSALNPYVAVKMAVDRLREENESLRSRVSLLEEALRGIAVLEPTEQRDGVPCPITIAKEALGWMP